MAGILSLFRQEDIGIIRSVSSYGRAELLRRLRHPLPQPQLPAYLDDVRGSRCLRGRRESNRTVRHFKASNKREKAFQTKAEAFIVHELQ